MNKKEIMEILSDIKYGWIDKNNQINIDNYDNFSEDYILETPEEVIQNKVGICWDQVELLRNYFDKIGKKVKTYFIIYYEGVCPTHTFLQFEENNKYYWIEHAWEMFSGIHEYDSEEELITDVKNKYIENELGEDFKMDLFAIYEYKKPKYHLTVKEFFEHCTNGKKVD